MREEHRHHVCGLEHFFFTWVRESEEEKNEKERKRQRERKRMRDIERKRKESKIS